MFFSSGSSFFRHRRKKNIKMRPISAMRFKARLRRVAVSSVNANPEDCKRKKIKEKIFPARLNTANINRIMVKG